MMHRDILYIRYIKRRSPTTCCYVANNFRICITFLFAQQTVLLVPGRQCNISTKKMVVCLLFLVVTNKVYTNTSILRYLIYKYCKSLTKPFTLLERSKQGLSWCVGFRSSSKDQPNYGKRRHCVLPSPLITWIWTKFNKS